MTTALASRARRRGDLAMAAHLGYRPLDTAAINPEMTR